MANVPKTVVSPYSGLTQTAQTTSTVSVVQRTGSVTTTSTGGIPVQVTPTPPKPVTLNQHVHVVTANPPVSVNLRHPAKIQTQLRSQSAMGTSGTLVDPAAPAKLVSFRVDGNSSFAFTGAPPYVQIAFEVDGSSTFAFSANFHQSAVFEIDGASSFGFNATIIPASTDIRLSQAPLEVAAYPNNNVQITEQVLEVVQYPTDTHVLVTEEVAEIVQYPQNSVWCSSVYLEIIYKRAKAPGRVSAVGSVVSVSSAAGGRISRAYSF